MEELGSYIEEGNTDRNNFRAWEYPMVYQELMPTLEDTVFLCVGCWRDWLARRLSETYKIIGIDTNIKGETWPHKEFNTQWGSCYEFRQCEQPSDIPVEPNSIDKAFSISVVEHSPGYSDLWTMNAIRDTLKPGGLCIITSVVHRDPNKGIEWENKQVNGWVYDIKSIIHRLIPRGMSVLKYIYSGVGSDHFTPFMLVLRKDK